MSQSLLRSKVRAFLLATDLATFVKADALELYACLFREFGKLHEDVSFADFHATVEAAGFHPTPASYTLKRKSI